MTLTTTRRQILKQLSALGLSLHVARGQEGSERKPNASDSLTVPLAKVIKNALVLDISPDSKKLCVYFSRKPFRSFGWSETKWRESKDSVNAGDEALRILRVCSWESEYATELPALPYSASFFGDSEAVHVGIPGVREGYDQITIDVPTRKITEHVEAYHLDGLSFEYRALNDRVLLGSGIGGRSNKTEVLVKVDLPSYREIQRVEFARERSPKTGMTETPITVSADRTVFAYGVDNNVVYRRADDLSIVWSQQVATDLMLFHVGLSRDGDLVAASACDTAFFGIANKYYVGIYDGLTGKELTRLPADGRETVAISPDKKLVAVGKRTVLKTRGQASGFQPTVFLYEIGSGKKVATLIHDEFHQGRHTSLIAGVSGAFTPDGKYLITSGLSTKIWNIHNVN